MSYSFDHIFEKAHIKGIKVEVVRREVIEVTEDYALGVVKLYTACGSQYIADKVIIACGTFSKMPASPPHSQIYHSPYPISKLCDSMPKNNNVAVIGARLSAIDAVIGLVENGHKGEITVYSRSSFFPSVRGMQGRYKNTYLSFGYITQNYTSLHLSDLAYLFQKEMELYNTLHPENAEEQLSFPLEQITDIKTFLDKEIILSGQSRGWQAVLYDTNSIISNVWNMLPKNEKKLFINTMLSSAMSLRVSIPAENAKKISSYIKAGQLKYVGGEIEIKRNEENVLAVITKEHSNYVQSVIYATGSPRDIHLSDSALIKNIIHNGLARSHPLGGIDVCNEKYSVFNSNGKLSSRVYAIGEITHGKFLFTSALDIIASHAHNCAQVVHKAIFNKSEEYLPLTKNQ